MSYSGFNFVEVSDDFEEKIIQTDPLKEKEEEPKESCESKSKSKSNHGNGNGFDLVEQIFQKFGVSLSERKILQPAWTFDNLNQYQKGDLAIFQNNLLCFRDKFCSFVQSVAEYKSVPPLIQSILREFHEKSVDVIKKMSQNLLEQMKWKDDRLDPTGTGTGIGIGIGHGGAESIDQRIIEELFSGNINESLKVVPSRRLACQLGISDQKLRREIYSARQRANLLKGDQENDPKIDKLIGGKYKKRKGRGSNKKGSSSDNNELEIKSDGPSEEVTAVSAIDLSDGDADEYFSDFYSQEIPICASPPSSTHIQSDVEVDYDAIEDNIEEEEDAEMEMMSVVSIFETSDLLPESKVTFIAEVNEVDGWLNIEAWLKSDLFEKEEKEKDH